MGDSESSHSEARHLVSPAELALLEAKHQGALDSGDASELDVIGFGEVSTVLRYTAQYGTFACKRLLTFASGEAAAGAAALIREYVVGLEEHGVDVVETEVMATPSADGGVGLYCVQPALPGSALGPEHFRTLGVDEAVGEFRRILDKIRTAVTDRIAPDCQLSNWAFVDERLVYIDVTTPFLRDENGNERGDWKHLLGALPFPVSSIVHRFALSDILESYFSARGQVIDFLGNLEKEKLDHLIPHLLPIANRELELSPEVTEGQVRSYYAADARTYAALQAACRLKCWLHHKALGRPLPYLPKPRIRRHHA